MSNYGGTKSKSFPLQRTLVAGERQLFTIVNGDVLKVKSLSASSAYTYQIVDPLTGSAGAVQVGSFSAAIGPYEDVQKILVINTAGSVGVTVGSSATLAPTVARDLAGSATSIVLPDNTIVPSSPSNINALPPNLPKWRSALAKMRAGTYRPKLGVIGTSRIAGFGTGTTGGYAGMYQKSVVAALIKQLIAAGVPAQNNSLVGNQRANVISGAPAYPLIDPRVTLGAGWSFDASVPIFGGYPFAYANGSVSSLVFTPENPIDTIVINYVAQSGFGTFTTTVDGGASQGTTNTAVGSGNMSVSYTVAKGTHSISINAQNNGVVKIKSILCYDSTSSYVDVYQMGAYGATALTSVDQNTTSNSYYDYALYGLDLAVWSFVTNDANAPVSLSNYRTRLQLAITQQKAAGGDILLLSEGRVQTENDTDYVAIMRELAIANSVPFVDTNYRQGSWAAANTLGLFYDGFHESPSGAADKAVGLLNVIARA